MFNFVLFQLILISSKGLSFDEHSAMFDQVPALLFYSKVAIESLVFFVRDKHGSKRRIFFKK